MEEKEMRSVERWGMFEVRLNGHWEGNPFVDRTIQGIFRNEKEEVTVDGFYDGVGEYCVRFMPSYTGEYQYEISGTFSEEVSKGTFQVTEPAAGNHGPVRVVHGTRLAYEDGTPYNSLGTTCYAWVHQDVVLQRQTLSSLADSPFNKIRFCFFPKFYLYNTKEPDTYPYERGESRGQDTRQQGMNINMKLDVKDEIADIRDFDGYRFNAEHFRKFDRQIKNLMDMGIEADLILLHPYDKWGFSTMSRECDELYLKYVTARYAAYRNVWWSLANEYDLLRQKTEEDWDAYGELIREKDPWQHLRSIHNCLAFYDYSKDWITHCSMQRIDLYKHVEDTDIYEQKYKKPIVWDEIAYEGNIDMGWGNITGKEMVRRFWESVLRGGYAGHGETYCHYQDILWWSHGGELHGKSPKRIAFLEKIMEETPGGYLKRGEGAFDELVGIPINQERKCGWGTETHCDYEIHYYGFGRPAFRNFKFPENERYRIEVIDTWKMKVIPVGTFSGKCRIELPGKQYMAIRLIRES